MDKFCGGLYRLGDKVIVFFALLSAGVLLFCNLLRTCWVGYDTMELIDTGETPRIFIFLAVAVLVILLILQEKLAHLQEK